MHTYFPPDFFDVDAHGKRTTATRPKPIHQKWDSGRAKPLAFHDSRTGTTFYAESDGRHLAAINADGFLLWVRNPFDESRECPYRTSRPVISKMEPVDWQRIPAMKREAVQLNPEQTFLRLTFDSSQFGFDEATGDFWPEGQN